MPHQSLLQSTQQREILFAQGREIAANVRMIRFGGSVSSSVQDELINELLPFALRFTSRSRVLASSLDELVARKMTQNHESGSRSHEKKPEIWKAPLREEIKETRSDQDEEIIAAA